MDTVVTEGSSSNDALKDFSKSKVKLNGDVNGTMNAIEVDADSHDSDYKKDLKDSLSGDGSNDGSSKINNGGEHSCDTEDEHSEEDSQDVNSSNSKLKNSENSFSHQGVHEPMEVDGESVNSEEITLANSDIDNDQSNQGRAKRDSEAEIVEEVENDDGKGSNKEDNKKSDVKSNNDIVELDSDQSQETESKLDKSREDEGVSNMDISDNDKIDSVDTENTSLGNINDSETPKKNKVPEVTITPRRSSRTVQRPVRFGHEAPSNSSEEDVGNESDEIEEITPQDPLADTITDFRKIPRKIGNTTIVVKDTKRLADIAARNTNTNKKEPTLVIIDTNSILSGRGAVPVAPSGPPQIQIPSVTVTPQPHIPSGVTATVTHQSPQAHQSHQTHQNHQSHHVKPYPGLPSALPAQGLYPPKPVQKPPPILPMLTDDMYVVEAPSFIVPYVYEKPPVKKFKKYVKKLLKQIRIQEEEEEEVKKEELAKEKEGEKTEGEDKVKESPEINETASLKKEDEKMEEVKTVETSSEPKKDEMKMEGVEEIKDKNEAESQSQSDDKEKENEKEKEKEKEGEVSVVEGEVKGEEKKVSAQCDSIEDSIKINEVKKKDEGAVMIKEVNSAKKINRGKENKKDGKSSSSEDEDEEEEEKKKPATGGSYFDNPLGKFFMQIGMNLVQQFVQTDLLKQHKKKQKMGKGTEDTQQAINSLKKNLQMSKENNEPYTMEQNKCDYCSFKTESKLIMAHHLETPHMRNYVYRCNFCPLEVRGPHDILLHMEAEHNIRGRLERAPAFHQCPQCPFEDNQKGKLTRHLLTCAKKFRPEKNLEPPMDWEPPAKIPRMTRKPPNMPMNVNNSLYQQVSFHMKRSL